MNDRVDPVQQCLDVAAGDVHQMVLEPGTAARGLANVEPHDPLDMRLDERGDQARTDEPGGTGDGDGTRGAMSLPRLTA